MHGTSTKKLIHFTAEHHSCQVRSSFLDMGSQQSLPYEQSGSGALQTIPAHSVSVGGLDPTKSDDQAPVPKKETDTVCENRFELDKASSESRLISTTVKVYEKVCSLKEWLDTGVNGGVLRVEECPQPVYSCYLLAPQPPAVVHLNASRLTSPGDLCIFTIDNFISSSDCQVSFLDFTPTLNRQTQR